MNFIISIGIWLAFSAFGLICVPLSSFVNLSGFSFFERILPIFFSFCRIYIAFYFMNKFVTIESSLVFYIIIAAVDLLYGLFLMSETGKRYGANSYHSHQRVAAVIGSFFGSIVFIA